MARFRQTFAEIAAGDLRRPSSPPSEFTHRSIGRPIDEHVLEGDSIRIEWPCNASGRARTIITRSGMRRRYIVPCFRDGDREAHGEAAEERDLAILLDACPGIQFQEQPAMLAFPFNNEECRHYPDFFISDGTRKSFAECKNDEEAADLEIQQRTVCLKRLLRPLGFEYHLVTTSQLHSDWFLENAICMRRRATIELPPKLIDALRAAPRAQTPALRLLSSVARWTHESQLTVLYAALYQGLVTGDLSKRISLDMRIKPSNKEGEVPWVWHVLSKTN